MIVSEMSIIRSLPSEPRYGMLVMTRLSYVEFQGSATLSDSNILYKSRDSSEYGLRVAEKILLAYLLACSQLAAFDEDNRRIIAKEKVLSAILPLYDHVLPAVRLAALMLTRSLARSVRVWCMRCHHDD